MNTLRQFLSLVRVSFKSLPQRLGPSLVIVIGIACVVTVLLSMMSSESGMRRTRVGAGRPDRVLITSSGAQGEGGSSVSRDQARIIMDMPGIKKDTDGVPIASTEVITSVPWFKKGADIEAPLLVRAFGAKGFALRPELKLTSGHMYVPGRNEAIIGELAQSVYVGLNIGNKVRLPEGEWTIVGTFVTGGDVLEQDLIVDADTALPAFKRMTYNSVIARLTSVDAFDTLKAALAAKPDLGVQIERQNEYYARTNREISNLLLGVTYLVGGMMAAGALFGSLNTMYSAVSTRAREIATLRAIGFGAGPILFSIMFETLFLALTGLCLGAALAWIFFNGKATAIAGTNFHLAVTPDLLLVALEWTVVIALIGGLFPALRATRVPVVSALRAT